MSAKPGTPSTTSNDAHHRTSSTNAPACPKGVRTGENLARAGIGTPFGSEVSIARWSQVAKERFKVPCSPYPYRLAVLGQVVGPSRMTKQILPLRNALPAINGHPCALIELVHLGSLGRYIGQNFPGSASCT